MLSAPVRNFGLSFVMLGLLIGCGREPVAPGDPVAAVEGLAKAIKSNDLVTYSKLSLPPKLHAEMDQRWNAELALAPGPVQALPIQEVIPGAVEEGPIAHLAEQVRNLHRRFHGAA